MTWLLLTLGFFLLMFGILSQAYSLKTKRGVFPQSRSGACSPGCCYFSPACC